MKRIIIAYFPIGLKYATPLPLGLAGYSFIIERPVWAIILLLLTVIIWTTNYVTEIDLARQQYRDFLSFLWIPFQEEKVKFSTVNKIIISKERHSQKLNSRAQSRQLDWSSYTATLIVDSNRSLTLLTRNDKYQLMLELQEFVEALKVDVEDFTTGARFYNWSNKVECLFPKKSDKRNIFNLCVADGWTCDAGLFL